MLLPAEYIAASNEMPISDGRRRELIVVQDVRNGFLSFKSGAKEGDPTLVQEVALFKKTGGGYVAAVTNYKDYDGDAPSLLSYENGKWTKEAQLIGGEITEEMVVKAYERKFPKSKKSARDFFEGDSHNSPLYCRLPRVGRTIKVLFAYFDEDANVRADKEVFAYEWDGGKFIFKEL